MRARRPWVLTVALVSTLVLSGESASPVFAEAIGTNLRGAPNDSVCSYRPETVFPETRYCSVVQWLLDEDLSASDGLTAPVNGTVVGWSVVAGSRSQNTAAITLALRTGSRSGPVYGGPEVLLPTVAPGTRVHFAENLPIDAGAQLALRIGVTTGGTQEEVGAPLAFAAPGAGTTESWLGGTGEPWPQGGGLIDTVAGQVLLLEAEIASSEDTSAPAVRKRFAKRQNLRRGAVIWVRSSEQGRARASAKLLVAGVGSFKLTTRRIAVQSETWTALRIPLRPAVRRAVRTAEEEEGDVTLRGRARVVDAAGNDRRFAFQVKPLRRQP
jgi:hypothetical protein